MSFKLTVKAFEARVGNPLRKLILIKLADQANDQGLCWPSYETIAHHCESSRRSVISHIKKLEEDGFLRVERSYNAKTKKNSSNRYYLTLGSGENAAPPSENSALGVVKNLHHPSEKFAPKPITEPINKEPINNIKSKKPKKTDFVDFEFTETQTTKCSQYGIDIDQLLESFKDYAAANGKQYVDWSRAFNTWITNHINWNKLTPVTQKQLGGNNNAKQSKLDELEQYINSYGTEQSFRDVN